MKLANRAYVVTLILLLLVFGVSAQKSDKDDRNTAPTVGTGGPAGGPTGLFTVYDGHTLRKGEFTLSLPLSNYDRDPGNVDITSIPMSAQVGLSNRFEIFFNTDAYRRVRVGSPRNLSAFYLPNSQVMINGVLTSAPAIILAPNGPGTGPFENGAVFRPTGAPFAGFPYFGSSLGTFGLVAPITSGPQFGQPAGNATIGTFAAGGAAGVFPGVGSVFGGILPGVVLSTVPLLNVAGAPAGTAPVFFTLAPTYVADAPFINRLRGTSAFNFVDFGFKWRFNDSGKAIGYGMTGFYRMYLDDATTPAGFNMMQRGAGPGGNNGDVGLTLFADARLASWVNLSGNVGYIYTSKAKGLFGTNTLTMLDRPDELQAALGVDFPINKHIQPIVEFRSIQYVGGRTPNAFENNPLDALAGIRAFPKRWFGFGLAYRMHLNQQDSGSFNGSGSSVVVIPCRVGQTGCVAQTITNTFSGVPNGFVPSANPHGYIAQFWIGHRDKRAGEVVNLPAQVNSVTLGDTVISLPCPPGFRSRSGACNDSKTISVETSASDPENDVLTYNYTVSGGRIVGTGAKVSWDLSSAQPGTYTITTGVDDGCGVCGKTDTKTIRVEECPDCVKVCDCPALSVSGPSGITQPGDSITFTASTSGDVTYNWSVSSGSITSGQGTPSITVATTREMANTSVTATVEIGGLDPACNCTTTASATADIAGIPPAVIVDEFGKATDDDVKARVDNFYIQLNNNPNARGYIINYGTPAEIKKRRAQIVKAINFRKYDISRVTFVDGPDNGTGVNTKFYTVPAGAENPTP